MKINEDQLYIQRRADKTLQFGSIILNNAKMPELYDMSQGRNYIHEIIGKPMDYGRLAYLRFSKSCQEEKNNYDYYSSMLDKRNDILEYSFHNPETCNQTILERPDEFISLVIAFLDTLPPKQE